MIKTVNKTNNNIKKAFADGGFINGIKTIGGTILSFVLRPIEMVLNLLSKIPGVGKYLGAGANSIAALREAALNGFGAVNNGTEPVTAPITQGERTAYSVTESSSTENIHVDIALDEKLKGSVSGSAPNASLNLIKSGAFK